MIAPDLKRAVRPSSADFTVTIVPKAQLKSNEKAQLKSNEKAQLKSNERRPYRL